jgi:hypothetical protein
MFHLDVTVEDTRAVFSSKDGHTYTVKLIDGPKGEVLGLHGDLTMDSDTLRACLDCLLSNDGEGANGNYEKASTWHTFNCIPHHMSLIP